MGKKLAAGKRANSHGHIAVPQKESIPGKSWLAGVVFTMAILLALPMASGAQGTGGTYDINFTTFYDAVDQNSDTNTLSVDITLGDTPTGVWAGGSINLRAGVYFDQNKPTVSISAPTDGSSTTSTSATLTYSGSSIGNPITNYWVQVDSAGWIDKDLNTSHDFTGLSVASHTFYVVATDSQDFNSTAASVSITITAPAAAASTSSGGGTSSSSGGDSGGGGGGGGGGKKKLDTLDNALNLINKVVYPTEAKELENKIVVDRDVIWRLVKAGAGTTASYFTFVVGVRNNTGQDQHNVEIIEEIPKEVANHVKRINFEPEPTEILEADPKVKWVIDDLPAGADVNIHYTVNGLSTKSIFDDFQNFLGNMKPPQAGIAKKPGGEEPACRSIDCDDSNVCTRDTCSGGVCGHQPRNGVSCGQNKVCKQGVCTERETTGAFVLPEIKLKLPDLKEIITSAIIVVVLAAWALVGILFVFYRRRRKRHPWGLGEDQK